MIAELIGGILGGVIVYAMYSNHWAATEDPGSKLGVFATTPARRNLSANFLTEAIATAVFIIGIQTIFKGTTTSGGQVPTFMVPLLVGFLIFAMGASCGGPTGYALNPARDMGPRIAHAILPIPGKGSNDWQFGLISATAGPFVGGIVAFVLWKVVAGF
jgi:glycerol uptake facilitator protein